jgi:hypothetical protein
LPEWVFEHHGKVEAACLELEKTAAAKRLRASIRDAVSMTQNLSSQEKLECKPG